MNATEQTARRVVIVAYKPKPGCEDALLELALEHVPILRREGLATKHPATLCRSADGTIIEVFEWAVGGIERAHSHPAVNRMWHEYAAVCTYVPLNTLAESADMFAGFTPVE